MRERVCVCRERKGGIQIRYIQIQAMCCAVLFSLTQYLGQTLYRNGCIQQIVQKRKSMLHRSYVHTYILLAAWSTLLLGAARVNMHDT